MLVEIIADVTCPWCFIGLKRLQQALARRSSFQFTYIWRPFLLNPELRQGSIDRMRYLERVFGSKSRIRQFHEAIEIAGTAVGIDFAIETAATTPSSINAHSVIIHAGEENKSLEMAEAIFEAHFVNRLNIGEQEVLIELSREVGLDIERVYTALNDEARYDAIIEANTEIHRLGINGVPSFVFAGKNIISGAQEPETLLHLIDLMAVSQTAHEERERDLL